METQKLRSLPTLFLAAALSLLALPAWALNVGDTLPCTTLKNIYPDGSRINKCIAQPEGELKFTLLEFASAQCGYCTQNIPFVSAFAADIRGDAAVRLVVIDRNEALIDQYVKSHRAAFGFPVAYDTERKAFKSAGLRYTPTFLLLDQSGKILFIQEGTLGDAEAAKIKALIGR